MNAMHTLALALALLGAAVGAQPANEGAAHEGHHAPTAASSPQSEGEVRKVDLAQGKVTLRHGPLANLDMPAMTMVFTAADPRLLEGLKQGDKVRFTAERQNGVFVVTAIQIAR